MNSLQALRFSLAASILFSWGASAEPAFSDPGGIAILADGSPRAVAVIADTPSKTARHAAREWVKHLERASNATFRIVSESDFRPEMGNPVFIGVTEAARKLGIDPDKLGPDEYVLRIEGKALYVLGRENPEANPLDEKNNRRGTLFGVLELLHRVVGVRWLWPGELGTVVPRTDSLVIPGPLNERHAPSLRFRALSWKRIERGARGYSPAIERLGFTTEGLQNYRDALERYLSRHRTGFTQPKPGTWHKFSGWWKQYGEEHPDWFMMNEDGQRGPGENASPSRKTHVAICVSNPDLHRFIVHEDWDGGPVLCLCDVDRRVFCQCPECLAWDGPQPDDVPEFARPYYAPRMVSDRYARFWKTVYALAAERNPDVTVSTYLYLNYLPAPLSGLQLHEKIYGEFVPWGGGVSYFPMPDEAVQWLREQWVGWEQTGITLAYRPNYLHGGYVMPHISTRQAGEFLQFAFRHGMVGTYFDSLYGHWATKGPMLYLHLRLFWDPELEIDDVLDEYYSGFGPAAALVRKYFEYWESYSRTRPGGSLYNPVYTYEAYPPDVFRPAKRLLEEALAAAQSHPLPEFAERVAFLQAGLEHARLAARFTSFLDYGPRGKRGFDRRKGYHPIPVRNRKRFQKCQAALRELIAFRRAHEHLFIADFVDAARRENRRMDTDTLLGK